MSKHYHAEVFITSRAPVLIKIRINKHDWIKEPTKIRDTIGKVGVHTKHPGTIECHIEVQ